ncbi:MAG: LamG-like jellyroll fold domain-containing protein [Candidatus Nitrosoabyssus spongiisocia]|nr:MAG: LamG-like jellyroll fold domain-containing protein [Nitrosopumilaceae archaeon AB1(1)]
MDENNGVYLELPDLAGSLFNNTDFTISIWANIDIIKSGARIIDFGNGEAQDNILIATTSNTESLRYEVLQTDESRGVTASDILQEGQWAYFTVVHESSGTATIYKNGTSITSGAVHTSYDVNRASNYIGRSNWEGDFYFDGKFDEFRLSSTARSADWIATEYANQNSPSTFFNVSGAQDRSGATVVPRTAPIITLNGSAIIYVEQGSAYTEQGATAHDGSAIVIGGDTVDIDTLGNYTITYDSADSAGNNAIQVKRIIVVRDTTNPIVVGTPIYDTLAHTLTVTFSENVIIPNSPRLGIIAGAFTTTNVDSTNNPILVFTFNNSISENVINTNLQPSSGANVYFPTASVLDTANNALAECRKKLKRPK